jgi:hypothetical protein
MCPTDTTPDPRDMQRAPDTPEFVQPPEPAVSKAERSEADEKAADIADRPPLPDRPLVSSADIEDEEADPVGSDQPGLAERAKSDSTLQRG